MAIENAGIHESMNDYHANTAIGSSQAKQAKKSIRLYKDYLDGIASFRTTPAMAIGTAIHAALLEPLSFSDAVVVSPYDSFRTREAKEWKAEELKKGVEIVSKDLLETIDIICNRTTSLDDIRILLENSESELVYRAEVNGLQCQCRFDAINVENKNAYDVKTTSKFDKFDWQVRDLGYDFSAGWYNMVYEATTGKSLEAWYWLVVETVPPYRSQLVKFDEYHEQTAIARDVAVKIDMARKLDEWDDETPVYRNYGEWA